MIGRHAAGARAAARTIALVGLTVAIAACGSHDDAQDAVPTSAPIDRGPTTVPTDAVATVATTAPSTDPTTTVDTAVGPPGRPDEVATLLSLGAPVERVVVFGDSLFASHTGSSLMFELVREGVLALDVGAQRIENYAVGGQGIVQGLPLPEPGWDLLDTYVAARLDDLDDVDLALIVLSRIDLNRMPVGSDLDDVDALAGAIADRLRLAVVRLESRGAQVAIVPALGTNDIMFTELQCGRGADYCVDRDLDAKAERLNRRLVEAGLPMLFETFAGTDVDGFPGVDAALMVDYDADGRWPDDGQHPNAAGERVVADNILHHLAVAFGP